MATLLVSLSLPPALARASTTSQDRSQLPPLDFRLTLVQRELATAPAESVTLTAIYRRQVRSIDEAATFFYSSTFLRLHLADQRQVIDGVLGLDPLRFLPQIEFLPLSLREEYRERAIEAAEAHELPKTLIQQIEAAATSLQLAPQESLP